MSLDDVYDFFKGLVVKKPTSMGNLVSTGLNKTNNFSDIMIMTGHTDIIRALIKIDERRCVSSSDDGVIIVWDYDVGESLFILEGHTGPVTAFLYKGDTLISGSVDKSLRIWDLNTGECKRVINNSHDGGIKSMVDLGDGKFCSGGNDKFLRIWMYNGDLCGKIERVENAENMNCMLAISKDQILVGSNSPILNVYRTDTLKFSHRLTTHRESIRCFININDSCFASGSLDGSIVMWKKDNFETQTILYYPATYISKKMNNFTESVNHFLVIGKRYLAACIDKGFKIFDTETGYCVVDNPKAHESSVHSIICVSGGTRFVTASTDAQLRFWGTKGDFNFLEPEENKSRKKTKAYYQPVLLGEMFVHTDQVKFLIKISENSFISGGHDKIVVLWKDREIESQLRNQDAFESLANENPEVFRGYSGYKPYIPSLVPSLYSYPFTPTPPPTPDTSTPPLSPSHNSYHLLDDVDDNTPKSRRRSVFTVKESKSPGTTGGEEKNTKGHIPLEFTDKFESAEERRSPVSNSESKSQPDSLSSSQVIAKVLPKNNEITTTLQQDEPRNIWSPNVHISLYKIEM